MVIWGPVAAQVTTPNPILAIGILGDKNIKSIDVKCTAGRYFLLNSKDDTLKILTPGDVINFTANDWNLKIKTDTGTVNSPVFTLQALDSSANFELASPALKLIQLYDGTIRLAANKGVIKLINKVTIEQYVDDVLRAEVGKDHLLELYKVQAVISRTYALDNLNKHKTEFFNLCDKVHCQVYNGKGKFNALIDSATALTRGEIITYDNKPITAAFHANCGGQTVNSEDVWNHPLPYLKSVTDTFCIYSPGAYWEKTVPAKDWLNANNITVDNKKLTDTAVFKFVQPKRVLSYTFLTKEIPLKQVRTDNKLRSTFFSCYLVNNNVIICGRGYGHGVGLCQEGASAMTRKGYDYKQIIHFYFKGVNIVSINSIIKK